MGIYKCIDAGEYPSFQFERREIQIWNEDDEKEPSVIYFELEVLMWNHFIFAVQ